MNYKIIIDVATDVAENYANWASDACKEFLELFPEYKDTFSIQMRYKNSMLNCSTGKKESYDPTISAEDYANLSAPNKAMYKHLPNGRYLVPCESMDWYEEIKHHKKGGIDHSLATFPQDTWVKKQEENGDRCFHLGVTNRSLYNSEGLFGCAISNPKVGAFVSTGNFDQDRFKRLIWHEFGHVFGAVHSEREHTTDSQYGEHCANTGCIMRDAIYANLEEANKPDLFCAECLEAMRKYLKTVTKSRTPQNQLHVDEDIRKLPDNRERDDTYKQPWRDFAKNLAEKTDREYSEDTNSINFNAKITSNDGSYVRIVASSANNVALSSRNSNGDPQVPDMETFRALVQKAQKNNQAINFGNIETAEFKARLLIACATNEPPIKMQNAPQITDDFLRQVSPESVNSLRIIKAKQRSSSPKKPAKSQTLGTTIQNIERQRD